LEKLGMGTHGVPYTGTKYGTSDPFGNSRKTKKIRGINIYIFRANILVLKLFVPRYRFFKRTMKG